MRIEDFWIDVGLFVVTGRLQDKTIFENFIAVPFVCTEKEAEKIIMDNYPLIQAIESIDEWSDCLLLKEKL